MPSVSKRGKAAGVDAEEPRVARGEVTLPTAEATELRLLRSMLCG